MSWVTKKDANSKAREAAKVYTIDERYQEAFIEGVCWAVDRFASQLRRDHYEDMKGYPHEMMSEMTIEDLRKTFREWHKAEIEK